MSKIGISCASYSVEGNTANVVIPIQRNLSVSSVILALQQFKNWKLQNVMVIFTEDGCLEFLFQNVAFTCKACGKDFDPLTCRVGWNAVRCPYCGIISYYDFFTEKVKNG